MSQLFISNCGSNFSTVATDLTPFEVFTTGSLSEIDPGHIVYDPAGRRYTVGRITLIDVNTYSVYLLPLPKEASNV